MVERKEQDQGQKNILPESRQSKQDVEAASQVNDEDALNTEIDVAEAQLAAMKIKKSFSSPGLLYAPSISSSSAASGGVGPRELIWKTAEGTEKRLFLPIEMIQEDVMDDPERLLTNVGSIVTNDAERAKILSALHEIQGAMAKQDYWVKIDENASKNKQHSVISAEQNIYIGNESKMEQIISGVDIEGPTVKGDATFDTSYQSKEFKSNSNLGLAKSNTQTKNSAKKRFSSTVKGKKQKQGPVRKNQSELLLANQKPQAIGQIQEDNTENLEELDAEEEQEQILAEMDEASQGAYFFERIKKKFLESETQLNDEAQLKALQELETLKQKKLKEEKERLAREAEEKKGRDEETEMMKAYGPGGIFGKIPSLIDVQQVLKQQDQARKLKKKQERDALREKLKKERLEQGITQALSEEQESEEEIDYAVVMQEEELVPAGQKELNEQERLIAGKPMRQIVRNPGKLVKLIADSILPPKLPDNLIYWNKCETRIESSRLITYSNIQNFQKTTITQFEDKESQSKVMKQFPIIDGLEMWQNSKDEKFANQHEKAIYELRSWSKPLEFKTEAFIKFERVRSYDCFFNSRFESGNLRQVFKVPQESDFDLIPADQNIPDHLPEEIQQELKEENITKRREVMKERTLKYIEEEKQEELEMKLEPKMREKKSPPPSTTPVEQSKSELEKMAEEQKEAYKFLANPELELIGSDNEENGEKNGEGAGDGEGGEEGKDKDKVGNEKKGTRKKKWVEPVKPNCEYNLYLQDDTNADSALFQWYYFSVMNIRADTVMRINICNLSKPNSLYAKGMKPFVYSINKKKATGQGWHRGGQNIQYFTNNQSARYAKKTLDAHWLADGSQPVGKDNYKNLHTLVFDYKFESDYDIVFFAHFMPYTYTDQINFFCNLHANPAYKDRMRLDYICNTIGKTPVYGLTITNEIQTKYVPQSKEIFKFRKFEYKGAVVKPKKIKYETVVNDIVAATTSLNGEDDLKSVEENKRIPENTVDFGRPNIPEQKIVSSGLVEPKQGQKTLVSPQNPQDEVEAIKKQVFNSENFLLNPSRRTFQVENASENPAENSTQNPEPSHVAFQDEVSRTVKIKAEALQSDGKSRKKGGVTGANLGQKGYEVQGEKQEKIYKKHIFITSRVHPGESQSSYIVHGLIQYLLSDEPEAIEIRNKFVVKVIPMLNPDGVIHGNYRVGLLGVDLNRRWKKPSKFLHPSIYYVKSLIKYFNEKSRQPDNASGGVVFCCDFHGHSRNMDLFMYCCVNNDYFMDNMTIRSVPVGVDRMVPIFNMKNCTFTCEKEKENTARVVLYKELGILASYTLEATYFGSEYFRKPKFGSLLTKEQLEYQSERYKVALYRKDISLDFDSCLLMGADFIRGVNFASKKRPLVGYWFRKPPANLIDPFNKKIGGVDDANEIDPVLLELEKAWRPIGVVKQDKHIGVGDRYDPKNPDGTNFALITLPEEKKKGRKIDTKNIALIDKLKKQKKDQAKKKRKNAIKQLQTSGEIELTDQAEQNLDMADVLSPDPKGGKKKKTLTKASSKSRIEKQGTQNKKGFQARTSLDQTKHTQNRRSDGDDTPSNRNLNLNPIRNRELIQESEEDDADEILPSTIGVCLIKKSQMLLNSSTVSVVKVSPAESEASSDELNAEESQQYLISRQLQTVPNSKNLINISSLNRSGEELKKSESKDARSSLSSPKRQLNLSVRLKDGKTNFKAYNEQFALPMIESGLENDGAYQIKDRIESRLLTDARVNAINSNLKKRMSSNLTSKADESMLKSNYNNRQEEDERQAILQLHKVSENTLKNEREMLEQLEQTKKHLTSQVSAQELDDIMLIKTDDGNSPMQDHGTTKLNRSYVMGPQLNTFQKNKLSVDPIVFPSSKLEAMAKIQMKTLDHEMTPNLHSLRSPRKSNKPSNGGGKSTVSAQKTIFAPFNAVYNQTQLLRNPELAKKSDIHFYINHQDNVFSTQHHYQMSILKQHLGMKLKDKKRKHTNDIEHYFSMQKLLFATEGSPQMIMISPETRNKGKHIFQQKQGTAGLFQQPLSKNSSLTTIQTAVGSQNFEYGFSTNDYVTEQMSLLERTRVHVAAKPKKRKHNMLNPSSAKQQPIQTSLVLPDLTFIRNHPGVDNGKSVERGLDAANSELGFILENPTTQGSASEKVKKKILTKISSMDVFDEQTSFELPLLSKKVKKGKSQPHQPHLQGHCIEVKNGFDFANNVNDRHLEKMYDLKHISTLREQQRKMSKPQFIIRPLDVREFLNIQMQNVNETDNYSRQQQQGFKSAQKSTNTVPRAAQVLKSPQVFKVVNSTKHFTNSGQQVPFSDHEHQRFMSPSKSRRTMSMGVYKQSPINRSPSPTIDHQSVALENIAMTPQPHPAKGTARKQIKQREVKSIAVRNLVNSTMVVDNKLLVFKQN